ncbi:MAG: Crp/Fnr family transcriptional regulator [Proteobacteria bacterium]|nr:Crp/Fnr family transcriptional regulator [Pseudomonadota bacterium]
MRLDEKIARLTAQPLLGVLEPAALHVIAFSASERMLKAGEELFKAGETSEGGFLILTGRIRAGGEDFGAGSLIGKAALLTETTHPVTVLALEPTVLLALPRALMLRVLEAHPASAHALNAYVADEVSGTYRDLKALL